ncbi:MAG: response regulator transcription factor, partial [bacterium]
ASGSLCASIQHIFECTGANVVIVHDESDGLYELNFLQPDLILLDVELSDGSDLDFLHNIRCVTSLPIIVVAGIEARDQSRFFDAGADDVVIKPFQVEILLARIKATLRRAGTQIGQGVNKLYDDGNLIFDPVGYQAVVRGCCVRLTPTEFKLLTYLVENAGVLCTFRQILKNVWGDASKNNR